tara:strand:+ start:290 stop:1483 length:1194 start_codon:yes stop_codon:yes gene_type:complete
MIKFGMKLPEIFSQLVRGYRKVTGRNPEGLDLIKIRQESMRRFEDMNKVVDMQGRSIDTSKGIMGGTQVGQKGIFDNIFNKMNRQMGNKPKVIDEDTGKGFIDFVREQGDIEGAAKLQKVEDEIKTAIEAANKRAAKKLKDKKKKKDDPEEKADGGRIGFKDGMNRRSFLKIMGGLAAIPVVGKFFKLAKTAKGIKSVPIVETAEVAGKPAWFDALVNKVIREGDDMTKQFATKEREIVHVKKLDEDTTVRVTQELDEGAVRVEYESPDNVFGDQVNLEYKKPLPDEGAPNPRAEFTTAESGPVGRQQSPDDYDIEIDEVGGSSIEDLTSDVSKLKEYATGKKPTMKEIVQNKKRKDKAANISNDSEAQMDDVIRRQGEMIDYDDYASGGIARMLGE